MKLLFFEWNSWQSRDMECALRDIPEIEYKSASYEFKNADSDEHFIECFTAILSEGSYDKVFSINFWPLVSEVCKRFSIPYISWSYDCPLNLTDLSILDNEVNTVYVFDYMQAKSLSDAGHTRVFHMPLAASPYKMSFADTPSDAAAQSPASSAGYACDVSFIGRLYAGDYDYMLSPLSPEMKGKINHIVSKQFDVYGDYMIPRMLDSELMSTLNAEYAKASGETYSVNNRQMEFLLASEVTRRERLSALTLITKKHPVNLYSNENVTNIPNLRCKGVAGYYSDMPFIFNMSRINLNISLKAIQTGIPLRVMDILSCGGFVLSNYQEEMEAYFKPGKEIVLYESISELPELIDYYLTHEEERAAIAKAGSLKALNEFGLTDSLRKILI